VKYTLTFCRRLLYIVVYPKIWLKNPYWTRFRAGTTVSQDQDVLPLYGLVRFLSLYFSIQWDLIRNTFLVPFFLLVSSCLICRPADMPASSLATCSTRDFLYRALCSRCCLNFSGGANDQGRQPRAPGPFGNWENSTHRHRRGSHGTDLSSCEPLGTADSCLHMR
jgi:hypothetical protein